MDLNILATIKRITWINMLGSIPHQKFCFYHLPTRGRAGIKLGDAWYVSNVSIIFDCSMLYYLLFWAILGFIIHFYIIFGTNLLTQSQCQFMFFPCFRVSQKRKIKRSPIDLKLHGTYFWTIRSPQSIGDGPEESRAAHKGGGVPSPSGCALLPHGFLVEF